MKYLHCQIRVGDFEEWKSVMEDDALAQEEAGLRLVHLWRSIDAPGHAFHPGQAFFVMEAQDLEKARAYFTSISITWARKRAGVHEYEWHFIEEVACLSPNKTGFDGPAQVPENCLSGFAPSSNMWYIA